MNADPLFISDSIPCTREGQIGHSHCIARDTVRPSSSEVVESRVLVVFALYNVERREADAVLDFSTKGAALHLHGVPCDGASRRAEQTRMSRWEHGPAWRLGSYQNKWFSWSKRLSPWKRRTLSHESLGGAIF